MNNQLENLRKSVDAIDDLIVELLAKRFSLIKKIGQYKKQEGLPFFDKKRWQQVLETKTKQGQALNLPKGLVKKIYEIIHQFALEIEKSL
jgi:chorismate mutase